MQARKHELIAILGGTFIGRYIETVDGRVAVDLGADLTLTMPEDECSRLSSGITEGTICLRDVRELEKTVA